MQSCRLMTSVDWEIITVDERGFWGISYRNSYIQGLTDPKGGLQAVDTISCISVRFMAIMAHSDTVFCCVCLSLHRECWVQFFVWEPRTKDLYPSTRIYGWSHNIVWNSSVHLTRARTCTHTYMYTMYMYMIPHNHTQLGLDKICLTKFEQNG